MGEINDAEEILNRPEVRAAIRAAHQQGYREGVQFVKRQVRILSDTQEAASTTRVVTEKPSLDTSIEFFRFDTRTSNCLKEASINTIGELVKLSEPQLLCIRNFGGVSLYRVKAALSGVGYELSEYVAPPSFFYSYDD